MLPFIMLFVVGAVLFAVFMAVFGAFFALATPLIPLALIAFAIWGLTRRSRAASAYPN
jgi:hypothetical protein